ncbi:hypothetical protein Cgig2_015436 [Carnegiea gigantea]|uniref:Uncharacterized protein n=1 Tax=Carnegiea gigantea TaxID=171969 RepID=A0A9Q1JXV1_9CARY|nr:hypothetical protein Cgig2_015436 [Carnegiea gigantea]
MARFDNAFALLGDEEGDDVTVLVEHIAKKVEVLSTQSKQDKESSAHFGQLEKVRDRGGQGRGGGRGGYWGNDNFQNGYRSNYYQDSYGNGEGDVAGDGYRVRGHGGAYRVRGGGPGRGRGRGFNGEYGQQNVVRSNEEGEYQAEQDYAGWYDEQKMHRNGGRYSGGERRGRSYRGQYYNDGVEQLNGEDLTGDYKYGDEEMARRNGRRNYGYERRGYGGDRGKGRREFRRADNGEVKESDVGDDADKSNEGSEVIAETAGKKLSAEGNEDGTETILGVKSRKLSEEEERREKEKEEQRQRREEERKKVLALFLQQNCEEPMS